MPRPLINFGVPRASKAMVPDMGLQISLLVTWILQNPRCYVGRSTVLATAGRNWDTEAVGTALKEKQLGRYQTGTVIGIT